MRKHSGTRTVRLLTAVALVATGLAVSRRTAAGAAVLTSRWANAVPDGQVARPTRVATSSSAPVSVSLSNNAKMLHVTLRVTPDEARAIILQRGFVVWFDPTGGQSRRFGVEFPVAPWQTDAARARARPSARNTPRPRRFGRHRLVAKETTQGGAKRPVYHGVGFDPEELLRTERTNGRLKRLIVLGRMPADRHVLTVAQAPGIHVALTDSSGVLTYRLTVPLVRRVGAPYAVGAAAGTTIGIGLAPPPPPPRSKSGRVRRRHNAFARQMARFWEGDAGAGRPAAVKVWLRARLAARPASG